MMVGGSQQETLNQGFMEVGSSRQETLDTGFVLLGTRQQGVPVISRELELADGFDLVSPRLDMRLGSTASYYPSMLITCFY
ncbi:unnamed protein product [Schistosoma margrebowiei]|uniref:Uncharacterized protein n=1 Tax=Schistosoma margrebowiei TaxID=48269 RepID=A0A183N4B7_9TREM|nr:unnamed protein product [Schistosoma margrebowiei]